MNEENIKYIGFAKKIVLLSIAAYIVIFFAVNIQNLSFDNIRRFYVSVRNTFFTSQPLSSDKIIFPSDSKIKTDIYKDGLVVLTQKTLTVYDNNGRKYSAHSVSLRNPVLKTSEKYIICFDRGNKMFYVMDSFNILLELKTEENIINATIDERGYISVITEKFGYKAMISVYDSNFNNIFNWYSKDYLLNSFFTSKNTLSAIAITPDKDTFDTIIYNINFTNGTYEIAETFKNNFILSAAAKEDHSIEMLTDSGIISFWQSDYNVLYDHKQLPIEYFYQDSRYTIVSNTVNQKSEVFQITAFDKNGNTLFEKDYEKVKYIYCFQDYFMVIAHNQLYVLDKKGTEVLVHDAQNVLEILVSHNSGYLINNEYAEKINIFSLIS